MYELKKKIGKVFASKSVGTRPSSYEKRTYRAAVSQRLRNTDIMHVHQKLIELNLVRFTQFLRCASNISERLHITYIQIHTNCLMYIDSVLKPIYIYISKIKHINTMQPAM